MTAFIVVMTVLQLMGAGGNLFSLSKDPEGPWSKLILFVIQSGLGGWGISILVNLQQPNDLFISSRRKVKQVTKEQAESVCDLLNEHGSETDMGSYVLDDYSGRNMYGDAVIAIVSDQSPMFVGAMCIMADVHWMDLPKRTDGLCRNIVFYQAKPTRGDHDGKGKRIKVEQQALGEVHNRI